MHRQPEKRSALPRRKAGSRLEAPFPVQPPPRIAKEGAGGHLPNEDRPFLEPWFPLHGLSEGHRFAPLHLQVIEYTGKIDRYLNLSQANNGVECRTVKGAPLASQSESQVALETDQEALPAGQVGSRGSDKLFTICHL